MLGFLKFAALRRDGRTVPGTFGKAFDRHQEKPDKTRFRDPLPQRSATRSSTDFRELPRLAILARQFWRAGSRSGRPQEVAS